MYYVNVQTRITHHCKNQNKFKIQKMINGLYYYNALVKLQKVMFHLCSYTFRKWCLQSVQLNEIPQEGDQPTRRRSSSASSPNEAVAAKSQRFGRHDRRPAIPSCGTAQRSGSGRQGPNPFAAQPQRSTKCGVN